VRYATRRVGGGPPAPTTSATAYWYGVWGVAPGSVAVGRLVLPPWRNRRHQLRVSAVVPESHNVVSVHITGRDLDKLPARAGQFFLWRFLMRVLRTEGFPVAPAPARAA
jgi:hypothetical protein